MLALAQLRGLGPGRAGVLVMEFFGWRGFRNRREVGAAAGLTGTPYASGQSTREQGISKAGNRRGRTLIIELPWAWLRYQPSFAQPLGMKQTAFEGYKRYGTKRVAGYSGKIKAVSISMTQPYAAGALVSTVDDLVLWDAAISSGKLLQAETWKQVFTPYKLKKWYTKSPFSLAGEILERSPRRLRPLPLVSKAKFGMH